MSFTSFCELPGEDNFMFIPAVVLVYHPSLENELSFIGSALQFNMANYTFSEYTQCLNQRGTWVHAVPLLFFMGDRRTPTFQAQH